MQGTTVSGTNEESGLYELRALANSAKKRHSERMNTQSEVRDGLLQSSTAVRSVVLPNPKKSEQIPVITLTQSAELDSVGTPQPTVDVEETLPPLFSLPNRWILVGCGLVAAVIAGVVSLGNDAEESEVAETAAASIPVMAAAPEGTPKPVPTVVPQLAEEEPVAVPVPPELTTDTVPLPAVPAVSTVSMTNTVPAKHTKTSKTVRSPKRTTAVRSIAPKAAARPPVEKKSSAIETHRKQDESLDQSLDELLAGVNTGSGAPKATPKAAVTSKKTLERSDIARAMKKISPAAKACHGVEKYSGLVKVKYSVLPSGSLGKTAVLGAHKSSKTGQCVLRALKTATFPAFSGATMSFGYPFLLSP